MSEIKEMAQKGFPDPSVTMTAQSQESAKMAPKFKRKKFFIHPSSQLKYIAFSVIPALVMSLYCTYTIMESGRLVLRAAKEKPLMSTYAIKQTIFALEKEGYTEKSAEKITNLKKELATLKNVLESTYLDALMEWDSTQRNIIIVLFFLLVFVGLLALVFSHRIAGPLYRIRTSVDMLAEGKNMAPIRLRKRDEFKELAASLENLRSAMKDKGLLEDE